MIAYCPKCKTCNEFSESALQKTVGCKACRHTWRLTMLLPNPQDAPGSMLQVVSNIARSVVSQVVPHVHAPPVTPGSMSAAVKDVARLVPPWSSRRLIQLEAVCAGHDEPFSLLYSDPDNGHAFALHRVEKGSHAIDRWCGTHEGRQQFERQGYHVKYQRDMSGISPFSIMAFNCPWCGSTDWFFCNGCNTMVCKGKSYMKGNNWYGVCRRSCPQYSSKGGPLSIMRQNLTGRSAKIVRQGKIEQQGVNILPAPARRRLT